MSRSPSNACLWLLHDAIGVRPETRGTAIDAPATYQPAGSGQDALLGAIDNLLPTLRGKSLCVRLGYPWAWHAAVPWQPRLFADDAWRGWTHASCEATGIEHEACRIALGPLQYGQPRLAALADAGLVDALVARAAAHQVRLRSVTSTFAHALHHYRNGLPGADTAVALRERGVMHCALRKDGAVIAIGTFAETTNAGSAVDTGMASLALTAGTGLPDQIALIGAFAASELAVGHGATAIWLGPHLPVAQTGSLP
ncbi:hypothetical protein [Cupriavidus agavae]|uniref:Uncharacterized protein n=1 Tax=Cupriavidus agavae TaxID=1001822 RepID=A0A4Q7RDQ3_9BURK|nr:hypothetical protein [Cupriavidus agavae]RZT31264.1 hypothetical protein EV147_4445 [Cupriavidus agavae]